MKYRLGLDVGTNSLGWSTLELNDNDSPFRIESSGVRIFSDGRKLKDGTTLKASRRIARSARRLRDRFLQRQKLLIGRLKKSGLFPNGIEEMKSLQSLNPLQLRSDALEKELHPYHIGRALFHLNQRRGFKSNRKDRSKETRSGKVSDSIRLLLGEMGLISTSLYEFEENYKKLSNKNEKKEARQKEAKDRQEAMGELSNNKSFTYGKFLWERQKKGLGTRAKSGAGQDGKLYDIYPQRELYEDEFNKIWEYQAKYHSNLMTEEKRKKIHGAIFSQRPLKPQIIGKCTYISNEDRVYRAMPTFQHYRIYQDVNNLEWTRPSGREKLIEHSEARDAIVQLLESGRRSDKSGLVIWKKMKDILKEMGVVDGEITFNFENPSKKGFSCNLTSKLMQDEDCVGEEWNQWSLEKQDSFITMIIGDEQDDEIIKKSLRETFNLSEYSATKCMNAPLQEGTANLSQKAAQLIMNRMKDDMLIQTDAVEKVAKENNIFKSPLFRDGELLDQLPYYGEAFQDGRHIIPGTKKEEDKHDDLRYFGGVTNPTVHIALNQIRHVVNELILRYGSPYSISIELGRDLPAGEKQRKEIQKEQNENKKINNDIDERLTKDGISINRDNRLRLKLWNELGKDNPCCPFSGKVIGVADLFNGQAEIEHLIPFSKSLDDSNANKILCTLKANRDKGNKTPFEAFGHSPDGYNWNTIFERSKKLSSSKRWRFQKDALEIWYRDCNDFSERHLNDTRYIARLTKEYLEYICPFNKIDVVTGRLTALLRRNWGLNSILFDQSEGEKKKNRDDHRHHAVDAIVIGMISRSILQKVSSAAKKAEGRRLDRLFEGSIDPWDHFRDEVKKIIKSITVSHKPNLKKLISQSTDGQLHNSTAYGIISGPDKNGMSEVVVRWPIEKFEKEEHVESIRDCFLKTKFLDAFNNKGKEGLRFLAKKENIRSLRRIENLKVIPVKDKSGKAYKAYKGDSNWGVEIYEYSGKWTGKVISRYEANQESFRKGIRFRPHSSARMIMRLKINDCIEISEGDDREIMRLQKLSRSGVLSFISIVEANVDQRVRSGELKYTGKSSNSLRKLSPRKVHVSPAGRVNYEKKEP